MILLKSYIVLYGPRLPKASDCLLKLSKTLNDLHISGGERAYGNYDFMFNWIEEPQPEALVALVGRIDECLEGLPTKYTIATESLKTDRFTAEIGKRAFATIFSLIRIQGPSISQALRAIEQVIQEVETTNTFETLKSSILVGEYDYAFEWDHWPTFEEIHDFMSLLDEKIEPTGALYTLTTKKVYRTEDHIDDYSSDNLMAFL